MLYGLNIVPFGEYANPRNVVKLAQAAETAGWEGLFVWDHLAFAIGMPSGDPWIILAAVTQATTRLKIGTAVTPLPRRRPQVLANTLATLDLHSQGRVIFGVGLGGVPQEFSAFGEHDDVKTRAAMLDEGLEIITCLWSGVNVNHKGQYYTINGVTLSPLPKQQPRIPIWVGGESQPALRRAARWDGWVIGGDSPEGEMTKSPEALAEKVSYIHKHRTSQVRFEVAITGQSTPHDRELLNAYETAGATWWLESIFGLRGSLDEMLERVIVGPP